MADNSFWKWMVNGWGVRTGDRAGYHFLRLNGPWVVNRNVSLVTGTGQIVGFLLPMMSSTCHLVVCLYVTFGYSELTDASGISMQSLMTDTLDDLHIWSKKRTRLRYNTSPRTKHSEKRLSASSFPHPHLHLTSRRSDSSRRSENSHKFFSVFRRIVHIFRWFA